MNESLQQWLYDPTIGKFVSAVLIIIVLVVLVRFVHRLLGKYVADGDARYRTRKIINFVGYFLGILLVASVFSDKLGGLTVALGVAGAGIAFALQEVIASIAGWFAISLSSFYKPGDRVQLGGIKGDVIDIGVLRTTLMEVGQWVNADLYNGRVVRVANSFVFKEPVFNYSGDFPFLWDEITVPVKYGSDIAAARNLLHKAADAVVGEYVPIAKGAWKELVAKFLIEDAMIDPMITLIANDNWIEFTVRYVVDYKRRRGVKDRLFSRILEDVEKTDGRVALASATFHLVETPVIDVRVANK